MTGVRYQLHITPGGVPIKSWTDGVELEAEARKQLYNVATLPFIHRHVAVMPDVHWGMGATIGSVIATKGAIIPAAVGVDIGCGMVAARTTLTANMLPDSLKTLRSAIEAAVPVGRTDNGGPNDRGAWSDPHTYAVSATKAIAPALAAVWEKNPKLFTKYDPITRAAQHMGTLGTGNHFIELCLDETDILWIMLHSGSRGIGNRIGTYFINLAKEDMRKWYINLPDKNLAYMPEGTDHFDSYIQAVGWAQDYAFQSRLIMLQLVEDAMHRSELPDFEITYEVINCHHNYVTKEHHFGENVWLTRKGAVRARKGDMGIIPGSMGVKSFIVRGLGNPESFDSCSHGAGRRMSRGDAKRTFTVADHIKATAGVECLKDESVLDETPGAYKDIDAVMAAQDDLVEIVHTLKQVVCVKG